MGELGTRVLAHKAMMDALMAQSSQIEAARQAIQGCNGVVYWAGNGGSAAMASHLAAEMVGVGRQSFALTDAAVLSALANDEGVDSMFARHAACMGELDVLVLMSTSGASSNILRAAYAASVNKVVTVGLSGSRGPLADEVTLPVRVPSEDTQLIQEAHLFIGHWITGVAT